LKIVFVHFGKQTPKHLNLNIERCINLFPDISIVLVTNRECAVPTIKGLGITFYDFGSEWQSLEQNLSHPKDFRENFWLVSVARFLALENYLANCSGEIIHVESDVILAPDFPFAKFSALDKTIAFPVVSQSQGIASTLYIRNHETAKLLSSFTLEMSCKDSKTTDMFILRKFYESHSNITQVIPTAPAGRTHYRDFTDEKLLSEMDAAVALLGGCFDGADIGYFLFGVDPRNDKGRKYIRRSLPKNYLVVPKVDIAFSKERNFLNIGAEEFMQHVPLYSLHIHSKNPALFHASRYSKAIQQGANTYRLPETYKFMPRIFAQTLGQAISRRFKNILRMKGAGKSAN